MIYSEDSTSFFKIYAHYLVSVPTSHVSIVFQCNGHVGTQTFTSKLFSVLLMSSSLCLIFFFSFGLLCTSLQSIKNSETLCPHFVQLLCDSLFFTTLPEYKLVCHRKSGRAENLGQFSHLLLVGPADKQAEARTALSIELTSQSDLDHCLCLYQRVT